MTVPQTIFRITKIGGLPLLAKWLMDGANELLCKICYRLRFLKKSVNKAPLLIAADRSLVINFSKGSMTVSSPEFTSIAQLRHNTSDAAVYREIFCTGEYAQIVEKLRQAKANVRRIIDLGGNVGLASLYFAEQFPNANVFAVEAESSNRKQFETNLRINNISDRIKVAEAAVWHSNSRLAIDSSFRGGSHWSLAVKECEAGPLVGKTIGALIDQSGFDVVDLLKIDIEGAEAAVFSPEANCEFLRRVSSICIEIHTETDSFRPVAARLIEYGFRLDMRGDVLWGVRDEE